MALKFSKEEEIIKNLLFNNKKLDKADFDDVDFDEFVKLSSSHLILPLIFIKLKQKNLLNYIPEELVKYLKEIHEINLNRNKELIKETKIITDILKKNKINYVLLKGTANILRNLYKDIGERMVGDIDILVESENGSKTIKLLNKIGYYNLTDDIYFDFRHLNRIINKKKIFAVEIHTRLFDKRNNLVDLKNTEKLEKIYVFNKQTSANYNIYNFQINDFGYSQVNYSYRSLYDHFLLSKNKISNNSNDIVNERFKKRYLLIARGLGIDYYFKYKLGKDVIGSIRFRLKKKFKVYNNFDKLYFRIKVIITNLPKQIFILIKNKKYRKYLYKKIIAR
tara:strand:- start:272 stop:1279 length:1008 start_codon:yes stop_codon:yes gene_type:complete